MSVPLIVGIAFPKTISWPQKPVYRPCSQVNNMLRDHLEQCAQFLYCVFSIFKCDLSLRKQWNHITVPWVSR